MKFTILKQTLFLCLSISASFFAISHAHAEAMLHIKSSRLYHNGLGEVFQAPGKAYQEYEKLNATFGFAASFRKPDVYSDWRYGLFLWGGKLGLPGYEKRYGVFKLQKSTNGLSNGPREDLVFESKDEAEKFCKNDDDKSTSLTRAAIKVHGAEGEGPIYIRDGVLEKSIAVAYWIAYDTGSQEEKDAAGKGTGRSIRAQKHVMCTNPWGWGPNPWWANENELTGIKTSGLRDAQDGEYYDVICMDKTNFPATTFWHYGLVGKNHRWTNGVRYIETSFPPGAATLHQFNVQLGAKYCPVS
jgi:hypothetical protein